MLLLDDKSPILLANSVKDRGLGPAANAFGMTADQLATSRHPILEGRFWKALIRHHLLRCH